MSDQTASFVGFGDLLMRLQTPDKQRIVQASSFDVMYTGAEANAAVMLSQLGVPSRVVSRVPDNPVGRACVNSLRRFGVDTTHIARGGERLGIFYLETGAAQRASTVVYDRLHTSFATAAAEDYDWDEILAGAGWLHFSGTAPALGEPVRRVLRDALRAARARGVTVSCDLNYRARLWTNNDQQAVMEEFAPLIDVLFGNEEDTAKVFGIRAAGSDVHQGALPVDSYRQVAEQLTERYGFRAVATSLRTSISASVNRWAGMIYDGTDHALSRTYEINPIVDRVGGGDSYAGGVIFGLLNGWPLQRVVEFAAAASCLKHSIPGDFNLVDLQEIESLVQGDGSGRVRR